MIGRSLYRKISISILVLFVCLPIHVTAEGCSQLSPVCGDVLLSQETEVGYDKRACWVSFLDIEDFLCDLDKESYICKIDEMYDRIKANHMNTVIFHVRPMCDAIYQSDYFPWSEYISSNRCPMNYDPLEIAIEEAHKKGLKFEAWINPYRVSKNNETTESFKQTPHYETYKDIILEYYNIDGELCMSLDPAREESVGLICDGVSEIVENYDVDGIHFDDYFYIDGMCDNLSETEKMENINYMISSVYKTIKDIKPTCEFGISPAGNMDNAKNDGADIETWLSIEGYVDYIMPQLYWSDEFITLDGDCISMFSKRCEEWQNINKLDKPIYAGLALYKVNEESENDLGWCNCDDNLSKQCRRAYETGYDGFALFRYEWLENEVSNDELNNLNNYLDSVDISGDNKQSQLSDIYLRKTASLDFKTYCQSKGIGLACINGKLSNIHTFFKGISSLSISLDKDSLNDGGIRYRTHICGTGWTSWSRDGDFTKLYSDQCFDELYNCHYSNSIIDGVQINLYGNISKQYDVFYRITYFDNTVTEWKCNGEIGGEIGIEGAISGIDIKIEPKIK